MNYKEQITSPEWQKKRLEIMQRDKFTCVFCGAKDKQLNVHHLIYMPKTKIFEYDNELLITLCNDCHTEIHELNKVIAIVAKNVIRNKIDLITLNNLLESVSLIRNDNSVF